ncbi:hypothetical protein BDR22DRAFT_822468 [Usnea florida]
MPPIRRYLRISQYSVLECRIYLDNPADAYRWLLNTRNPVLPQVIEAVRPLVLPKLREENARAKSGKGGKKKGWKDVVVGDDFEVAVFLTETSSRHSILRKMKTAKKEKGRLGSSNGKLTGTREEPVEVGNSAPGLFADEGEESEGVRMTDIPAATGGEADHRATLATEESQDGLFLSEDSVEGDLGAQKPPLSDGKSKSHVREEEDGGEDDKKKLGMDTTYDGFSIYGRILCLVVKRRSTVKGKETASSTGQTMIQEWISSTQMGGAQMTDD